MNRDQHTPLRRLPGPLGGTGLLLATALIGLAGWTGLAGCSAGGPNDADPVHVSVSTDVETVAPGRSFTLVWRFDIAPDWHLYWVGRNDSGFPPTIELDLPDGWIAGALQWPAPERHLAAGDILDHVYFDELVLLQKIGVPDAAESDVQVTFDATVEWLGCKEACVPGKAVVPVSIALSERPAGSRSAAWQAAHDALPQPLPEDLLTAGWDGPIFRVAPTERGGELVFMPTVDCGELVDLVRDGAGPTLALRFAAGDGTAGPVRGLLTVRPAAGPARTYVLDYPAQLLDTTTRDGG